MSATVDVTALQAQLKNRKAIGTGLFLQFVVLPLLGFVSVKFFNLDEATGITLLVVTSSPGGSYSNWWCSMFNADLALSVTMTAISTIVSCVMLPLNLVLYTRYTYHDDVVGVLNWWSLIMALIIVIVAIGGGIYASAHFRSTTFNLQANRLGNYAGIALVIFSAVMSNSDADARVWDREMEFFVGVALPCVLGLLVANLITTVLTLLKPECVTVSIECCYQNVGIATTVALAMFNGENQARAVAVPFYYGLVESVILLVYCLGCWKSSWTKAPSDVSFWEMISTSYEVKQLIDDTDEIEEGYGYVQQPDGGATSTEMSRTDSSAHAPSASV